MTYIPVGIKEIKKKKLSKKPALNIFTKIICFELFIHDVDRSFMLDRSFETISAISIWDFLPFDLRINENFFEIYTDVQYIWSIAYHYLC